ncbi:MAG TPA: hypothetical protein VGG64_13555 [Pirellulales bacterium]
MFGIKKKPEAERPKVRIMFLQGFSGMRTMVMRDTGEVRQIGSFYFEAGDVTDWDAEEARRMTDKGICRYVRSELVLSTTPGDLIEPVEAA